MTPLRNLTRGPEKWECEASGQNQKKKLWKGTFFVWFEFKNTYFYDSFHAAFKFCSKRFKKFQKNLEKRAFDAMPGKILTPTSLNSNICTNQKIPFLEEIFSQIFDSDFFSGQKCETGRFISAWVNFTLKTFFSSRIEPLFLWLYFQYRFLRSCVKITQKSAEGTCIRHAV